MNTSVTKIVFKTLLKGKLNVETAIVKQVVAHLDTKKIILLFLLNLAPLYVQYHHLNCMTDWPLSFVFSFAALCVTAI